MNIVEKMTRQFFVFNGDVFSMYALLSFLVLQKIPEMSFTPGTLYIFVANVLLIIAAYTLNNASDNEEDAVNNFGSQHEYNFKLKIISGALFLSATILYVCSDKNELMYYLPILIFLSIVYSFPKKFRFKKIFLIKNIVPAFCWAFSISLLAYSSTQGTNLPYVMSFFVPLFVLCFMFEMLWDIPDMKGDKYAGIRTLPGVVGIPQTKVVLIVCLMIYVSFSSSIANIVGATAMSAFLLVIRDEADKYIYHAFLLVLVIIIGGITLIS